MTPQNAVAYLQERGQIPSSADFSVRPLGGGVSNTVLLIEWSDDCFILKQPLRRLAVDDEWIIDQSRVFNERDGMRFVGGFLQAGDVPMVRFCDEENYVITMTRAAGDGKSWKQHLLAGHVDLSIACRAGALLAEFHSRTAGDNWARDRFGNPHIFIQGRVDPYYRTIAEKHPNLRSVIDDEIERLLATQLALIHGDYSSKNLMVQPDGRLMIIDFEIVHYGDPAFDVAFCLALLLLKAIQFRRELSRQFEIAQEFWRSYRNETRVMRPEQLEKTTLSQLGCMLLARIDGKSKVEYITENATKDYVRGIAKEILIDSLGSVEQAIERIRDKDRTFQHSS